MYETHEYQLPYHPDLRGQIVRIPFAVKTNAKTIHVELLDRPPCPAVFHLGIEDPTRIRGMSPCLE